MLASRCRERTQDVHLTSEIVATGLPSPEPRLDRVLTMPPISTIIGAMPQPKLHADGLVSATALVSRGAGEAEAGPDAVPSVAVHG